MVSLFRSLWNIVTGPPQFVVDVRDGVDRWGEVKNTCPAKENPFASVYFLTVYDIIWDDGEVEEGVPTHQFQWNGHVYVRNS